MQIHELNNFTGTLGAGAYLAIDDGTDTGKISSQGLLAATEARIDNIIAGPAPSAQEVTDARLGDDGVVYPSLGDAIRDQFSDVKSALSVVEDEERSFIHLMWEHGGIDNANGNNNNEGSLVRSRDATYYKVSDLYSIQNGTSDTMLWLIFYTESNGAYTFVNSVSVSPNTTYYFGDGAYVRFDLRNGLASTALISVVGGYSKLVSDVTSTKENLINQLISPILTYRGAGLKMAIEGMNVVQKIKPSSIWGLYIFDELTKLTSNYSINQYLVLACDPSENGNDFQALALCLASGQYYGKMVLFNKTTYAFDSSAISGIPSFNLSKVEVTNNGDGTFVVSDGSNSINIDISSRAEIATYNMTYCIGGIASKYYADNTVMQIVIDTNLNGVNIINKMIAPFSKGLYVSDENEPKLLHIPSYSVVNGAYYSYSSNNVVSANDWSYISYPIHDENEIRFTALVFNNASVNPVSFVDADDNFIGNGYSGASQVTTDIIAEVPSNAVKAYISYATGTLQNFKVKAESLNSVIEYVDSAINGNSFLYGKTINCLGDSITAQNQYTNALINTYGAIVNNYGISGSSISTKTGNAFYGRVSAMSDDCDCVYVLGGTNDWGYNAILGTKSDTTASTFCGGLYLLCEALRTKYPTKPIFIGTILQRDWQDTATDPIQCSGIDANANGNSIEEFNDMIKYFAHRYDLIVIDGYSESGIIVANVNTYLIDRLHPNALGGSRIASQIAERISGFKYLFE